MNMAQKLRKSLGVEKTPSARPLNVQYGHNETQIIMMLGASVDNLTMSVEQCNSMIEGLTLSRDKFLAYRGEKK